MTPGERHHEDVDLVDLVGAVPIFQEMDEQFLTQIASRVRVEIHEAGTPVYDVGEQTGRLIVVHEGSIKVSRVLASGGEQITRILGPGDCLGEHSLLHGGVVEHSAVALDDTRVCSLTHDDFRDVLENHPLATLAMLEALGTRLEQTETLLGAVTRADIERRLAVYLVDHAGRFATDQVLLPMSKRDLAAHLGVSAETLGRTLSLFEQRGWISTRGQRQIFLKDTTALSKV